jgi:hypothetical protein
MQKTVRTFLILLTLASVSSVFAQPIRFFVPLKIVNPPDSVTLYFGILPTANFCILEADSLSGHGEYFLPPVPPSGIFDTRFVWPRTGSNLPCFDQGSPADFRPFTAASQRDTIRFKTQLGVGTQLIVRWPANLATRFTGLTMRYFDQVLQQNVNVNMLTASSVDMTDAGDLAPVTMFSAGLVPTSVEEGPGVPTEFALSQNYPNPFNPTTSIQFSVVQSAMTDISVYDVLGKKVKTLASEMLTPGNYKVTWDGTNSVGSGVASGVYFVRMNAQAENGANFSAMRKLLLMK